MHNTHHTETETDKAERTEKNLFAHFITENCIYLQFMHIILVYNEILVLLQFLDGSAANKSHAFCELLLHYVQGSLHSRSALNLFIVVHKKRKERNCTSTDRAQRMGLPMKTPVAPKAIAFRAS